MALVAIQCKNCGGALQIDSDSTSYYCPHCYTTYTMEQTVNQNFQTTHIDTATIIDDGSGKIDQEINGGEALLSLRKYQAAQAIFQNIVHVYAHKYRAWMGLARAMSEDFTKEPSGKSEFEHIEDAVQSALQLAPVDVKAEINMMTAGYFAKWQEHRKKNTEHRTQRLEELERRTQELVPPRQKEIHELQTLMDTKKEKQRKIESILKKIPVFTFLLVALVVLIVNYEEGIFAMMFFGAPFIAVVFAFFPLKIICCFVRKGIRKSTKKVIKSSTRRVDEIETMIKNYNKQLEIDTQAVYAETEWLDK